MGRFILSIALALGVTTFALAEPAKSVKVTVLSTMLAGNPGGGIGEWGFAAVVEVDGRRLLVDTGARPETVLKNAAELAIDLSDVMDVVLTHNHGDHTGGLVTLRQELSKKNPRALTRAHVGKGIFLPRPGANGSDGNGLLHFKAAFEALGGAFVEHAEPVEILPSVWLTGPVPRAHPERNWSNLGQVKTPDGLVEDTIPEDTSIAIITQDGLVLVSGCGHAGMINTVEYARKVAGAAPVLAAIGGFHLFEATDATLEWTAARLRAAGLRHLLGAHCTGIEAVYRLRALLGSLARGRSSELLARRLRWARASNPWLSHDEEALDLMLRRRAEKSRAWLLRISRFGLCRDPRLSCCKSVLDRAPAHNHGQQDGSRST